MTICLLESLTAGFFLLGMAPKDPDLDGESRFKLWVEFIRADRCVDAYRSPKCLKF